MSKRGLIDQVTPRSGRVELGTAKPVRYPLSMSAAKSDAEARRREAQSEPIKTGGLEIPDYPKNVIRDELVARIKKGIYRPGEPFPSIDAIMKMTEPRAAKNTVRAAMDQLRKRGYIKTLSGLGTQVLPEKMWQENQDGG